MNLYKVDKIINVKLNNLNFRYDVFQMINLFYPFSDIEFVNENPHIEIIVENEEINIKFSDKIEVFKINKEHKIKEEVKKAVFNFLSEKTNKVLPWGTLVGIRPSKKALELLEKGYSEKEIIYDFYKRHLTLEEKAKLCIDVAKYERDIVNKDEKVISIYIGMPFCPTRCAYCSFASNPIGACKNIVKPYLESLYREIEALSTYVKSKNLKIECVYFGGGTPTSISDEDFEETMKHIYSNFVDGKHIKEFTVECGRPDSITENKLLSMKKYGVQRISINPQSMNDKTLKLIGRNHDVYSVIEKFNLAKKLGFDNINMDIIVGLPGEKLSNIEKTCEEIFKLKPESITVHGMSIKRASKLYENMIINKGFEIPNQDELNTMYKRTVELSRALDMEPYYMYRQKNMVGNMENIGYSVKGKECIYNIEMIEEKQTIIALGADAVSKIVFLEENRIERFGNVKDVREYIKRVDEMIEKKIELLNSIYK
ncbi:MAG: coproporphyrinogen III oxidase [Clostridium argentinense]|uniref:Coproporphyrinogen III oxidase n=1 Tax=Clostridium faecium TaxID=2762223 RepID=A0ABR8YWH9_9CLOT|nr:MULTISPECIES: coproporphyrinogen III oxidase [Clostridium]MBD8048628.1 coproporphyrinogen III oxidase [Clostridium faecium]MBS5822659.1 coproporphyrinogen III oxidase [Clostridium argentinense]MDU1347776.1 coproporphyrinogen III oxidase [Clostridium argentinense]